MSRTLKPPEHVAETKSLVAGETPPGQQQQGLCLLISSTRGVAVVALEKKHEFVIGRAPGVDILIQDESISRRHARLRIGDKISLEDLGSSNGTVVEDRRLREHEEVLVRVGSVFEIGATTVVLQRNVGLASTSVSASVPPRAPDDAGGPVIEDAAMKRLYALLDVVGPSPLSVLILGETGVGKEVFAEAIHKQSTRANERFLQINCAALPESILESELFGHEKGAFTGADSTKIGLFEAASGGTLFLDEIGETPQSTQVKLLRVLENGEILRIGGRKPLRVDVRFVSATNRDLRALIGTGTFRPDLYHRLNGLSVTLPPLRRRPDDILPLARTFVARACEKAKKPIVALTEEAERALLAYDWPGNVRELRQVVERALVMSRGGPIKPESFQLQLDDGEAEPAVESVVREAPREAIPKARAASPETTAQTSTESLGRQLAVIEKERILDALSKTAGNQSKAAKLLGITRRVLINRLDLYGIPRPRKESGDPEA